MNYSAIDPYPSRVSNEPGIISRQDPVVHGEGEPPAPLGTEQVEHYRENGFLLIPELFDHDEVEALSGELRRLSEDDAIREAAETVREPDSDDVRLIFRVHALSELYSRLVRDERLLNVARYILGDEVYIHQSRVNCKPAFHGKDFQWHSDFETWHTEDGMPRMQALSISLLLDDTNEFNGPLMLMPGSHQSFVSCTGETPAEHYKQSLRHQSIGVPDDVYLKLLTDQGGGLAAPKGPAGSVLLYDCNLQHGSASNISPYPRSNLFMAYNAVSNALQEPYCGQVPRPEFLATRERIESLKPLPENRFLQEAVIERAAA